ncbi:hypothetical protein AA0Y32_02190 [Georgenia phoenicis]|uniref:hypothetical protein n=1 Tax=unclassified Georgenia TaxID=2626815 RepID=UPI0039AF216B
MFFTGRFAHASTSKPYGERMTDDGPDGPAWRHRLRRVVGAAREWEAIGQREPEVHPRSELAGDDARWPKYPASSLVRMNLLAAFDHLGLAADDVERVLNQEGPLRTQAPFTLTRSALLGASHAVWVLCSEDREERVRRGLALAEHDLKDMSDYFRDYLEDDDRLHEDVSQDLLDAMRARYESIKRQRTAIAQQLGGKPPNATRILREAALYLTRRERDSWQLRALRSEWRMSSASAHGRLWPFFVRPTERIPRPGGGETRIMLATLQDCATAMGAATLMTSEALRLWDQRSSRPNAGAAFGL